MSEQTPTTPSILTPRLIFMIATAIAIIVANIYYAQPILSMIGQSIGLPASAAGLVLTFTQIGYGLGVLLIAPLGDILESRKLILTLIAVCIVSILALAFTTQVTPYFIAAFAVGLGVSVVQVLVPYVAHFAPEAKRGQIVGTLMSGLMIGIMLSRPVASLLTQFFSWHAVFIVSAAVMTILIFVLYSILPPKPPTNQNLRYRSLLRSMVHLYLNTPILRRRAFYQACLFGSFCLFWTASPMLLTGTEFHLPQAAIALFALVGISGAVAAPFAGKAADRGLSKPATAVAMLTCSGSFLLSHFNSDGSTSSLIALVISAILLDAGVTANLVLGQRAIFSLGPEIRSRLNGLYIASMFVGGSIGSSLGAWAYAHGGWALTSWFGVLTPFIALLYFFTELLPSKK